MEPHRDPNRHKLDRRSIHPSSTSVQPCTQSNKTLIKGKSGSDFNACKHQDQSYGRGRLDSTNSLRPPDLHARDLSDRSSNNFFAPISCMCIGSTKTKAARTDPSVERKGKLKRNNRPKHPIKSDRTTERGTARARRLVSKSCNPGPSHGKANNT